MDKVGGGGLAEGGFRLDKDKRLVRRSFIGGRGGSDGRRGGLGRAGRGVRRGK